MTRIWSHVDPNNSNISKSFGRLVALWLALRLISSVFISFISSLRPMTEIEQRIALLPPSEPLNAWLERAFIAPWLRWDAVWFTRIVTQGYHANDGTALFHPLYPLSAMPLYRLHLNPTLSLLLISALASLGLIFLFEHLAAMDLQPEAARFSTLLLFFAPLAFVFFAPYTDGLFLMFAVLCILWARKKSWWLAGLAGGLAALTRQQGTFLLIPVAWEMWESAEHNLRKLLGSWKHYISLGLIPAGYLSWIIYRTLVLSDVRPDFSKPLTFLSSLLLSPSGTNVVPIHGLLWPWEVIRLAVVKLLQAPDLDLIVNLILGAGFLVLLAIAWKNMRWGYRLYALTITIISFSFYTGPVHPYMGMPRHLLLAFPVFIGAAPKIDRPWKRLLVIGLSVAGWFSLLGLYGLEAWVP
jgi:hypothetical protein